MSHHYSGPNATFPRGDARLDLTDLYAFPKPEEANRSVIIVNFHPSSSVAPPRPTPAEPFAPGARYELRIDTNGDDVADVTYQVRFSRFENGGQTATLRTFEGPEPIGTDSERVIVEDVPVSMGRTSHVTVADGLRLFIGRRSDPFFFDVQGVLNNFRITGDDFFADKDVYSIVLDLPNAVLGSKEIGLWVRVLIQTEEAGKGWMQVERGARPAQTPFLTGDQNEAYRAGEPAEDRRFVAVLAHSLEHTGGYAPEEAMRAAAAMLPDVMHYDPRRPASFPESGRSLTDDVLDAFLEILTNGKVKGDGVGPHGDLTARFPYLGPPHSTPRP